MLLLSLLFCLACRVWSRAKVNYAFIFEFDTRHHLDWRQLSEVMLSIAQCLYIVLTLTDTMLSRALLWAHHVAEFQSFYR